MFSSESGEYKKACQIALEEATKYIQDYASTEYILFGLLTLKNCTAEKVLKKMGLNQVKIRQELMRHFTCGDKRRHEQVSWSPRALRIFYLAQDEARRLGQNCLGSEHLLLSLIREQDGIGGRVLIKAGATLECTRQTVAAIIRKHHRP